MSLLLLSGGLFFLYTCVVPFSCQRPLGVSAYFDNSLFLIQFNLIYFFIPYRFSGIDFKALLLALTGPLTKCVDCLLMVRETGVQSQVESYQRLKKWYLMPPCFNTQHYKVRIKGKVEQSRKLSKALPYSLV